MLLSVQELTVNKEMANGVSSVLGTYWERLLDHFGIPFNQYCFKLFYTIYTQFTLFNLMIFLVKCVPTGIYMYKLIKNIYIVSRERLKQKEIELEDIRLQIQIINTKIKLRDAEFAERGELLKRKVEQLHNVRKRVQDIIVRDEELQKMVSGCAPWEEEKNCNISSHEEECKFIMELMAKLKSDQAIPPERDRIKMNCGEHSAEPASQEDSIYSSANDINKPDYHVKIVKVTNVYKVAYLRHFIKQKRLRRANKQALLKKKMDSLKKLLDDWQKTLKMVINNKLINVDSKHNMEFVSQEAMGDFTKTKLKNSSDSDSDYRNSGGSCQDDYCVTWSQNQYRPVCSYDDFNTNFAHRRDCYDLDECCNQYNNHEEICDCTAAGVLFVVPEETSSQVEVGDIKT